MIPSSTLNICNVCGKPIEKTDFCYAESLKDAKIGYTYVGTEKRMVTKQHHLKCSNPFTKTLW